MSKATRELEELNQVSAITSMLAVALESGLSLSAAIEVVVARASGNVAKKFQRLLAGLNLGGNLHDELETMRRNGPAALTELVVKLQVAIQFGSPLADQLEQLAASHRETMANLRQAMATKQENTMLLPLVFLILPVTVLFAIYPSMQYLNLNY